MFDSQQKQRRSSRISGYDYAQSGYYFVTICTLNRAHFFGEIVDGRMMKNELGDVVEKYWFHIPKFHPHVVCDAFVVMPNHIHGVLQIHNENNDVVGAPIYRALENTKNEGITQKSEYGDGISGVSGRDKSTPLQEGTQGSVLQNYNVMGTKTLGNIIRWYKGRCTFECRKIQKDFAWQRNYHEHIIRNESSLEKIREYIHYNPVLWKDDCYYHI